MVAILFIMLLFSALMALAAFVGAIPRTSAFIVRKYDLKFARNQLAVGGEFVCPVGMDLTKKILTLKGLKTIEQFLSDYFSQVQKAEYDAKCMNT
jgi:hypothetical protein